MQGESDGQRRPALQTHGDGDLEIDGQCEGLELNERIEAQRCRDHGRPGRGVEGRCGAELDGVAGEREVGGARELWIAVADDE